MEYVLTGAFMDSTKVLDTVQNAVSDFKSGFQTPIIKNAGRKKTRSSHIRGPIHDTLVEGE